MSTSDAGKVNWEEVARLFPLNRELLQLSPLQIACHPAPVHEAIAELRRKIDAEPFRFVANQKSALEKQARAEAAQYLGCELEQIALLESTTMGLATVILGITLNPGQEILASASEHFSTRYLLESRQKLTGHGFRLFSPWNTPASFSAENFIENLCSSITPKTRLVVLSWTYSSCGLRIPLQQVTERLRGINQSRPWSERVLLCVDGAHALGVEDFSLPALGCDYFVSGCHKWLFGPRGTALAWATESAWDLLIPLIPPFSWGGERFSGAVFSPGGFQAFEHRWALPAAFRFHGVLGKGAVLTRTRYVNRTIRCELSRYPKVNLLTPLTEEHAGPMTCFTVAGVSSQEILVRLENAGIVGSVTPQLRAVRLAGFIGTTDSELDRLSTILPRVLRV